MIARCMNTLAVIAGVVTAVAVAYNDAVAIGACIALLVATNWVGRGSR